MNQRLTAIIERDRDGYVALCPELDIASQGDSVETARENLREALELFFEYASREEVVRRLTNEVEESGAFAANQTYPLWSPDRAYDAAAVLLQELGAAECPGRGRRSGRTSGL